MAKSKSVYMCNDCGNESPKWVGRCGNCGNWNTMVETTKITGKKSATLQKSILSSDSSFSLDSKAELVVNVSDEHGEYFSSGLKELDRVLGGGIYKGAVIQLYGDPGFGKSTILSQVASAVGTGGRKVLYSSGEESKSQGKKRFEQRLKLPTDNVYLQHTRSFEELQSSIKEIQPSLVIVDSVQTIGSILSDSDIGGPSQVKLVASLIIELAKQTGVAFIIIGQITKDGTSAGPMILKHMVDTVLRLIGEPQTDLRLIRPDKNRMGSTLELGVFEMTGLGLQEVSDPSRYSLADRDADSSGSVITCINDTRPILVEIQALVTAPVIENTYPKRRSMGYDAKRLDIVLGVLEKKLSNKILAAKDVLVNSAGGIKITNETSADLAVALAIYSSHKNKPIDTGNSQIMVIGEIGLTGEVRPVANSEMLIREAIRCGIETCILPYRNYESLKSFENDIVFKPVRKVHEAIEFLFGE